MPAPVGVVAGFFIGVVAAVMGVAGGELLIPTIVLLYAVDIKTAGSLSLVVSLPTTLVAFARYSRDGSFTVLRADRRFVLLMAGGSIAGTVLGGLAVGLVPDGADPATGSRPADQRTQGMEPPVVAVLRVGAEVSAPAPVQAATSS